MKNRLAELRAERNWSQGDLARHLSVSRQTVNAIENGRYDPSLPLAFVIALVFDQAIEKIFDPGRSARPCDTVAVPVSCLRTAAGLATSRLAVLRGMCRSVACYPPHDERTEGLDGEQDEPGLRTEGPSGQKGRACDLVADQREGFHSAHRKPEDGTLEEVPADVQADGHPQLACTQHAPGQEQARPDERRGRHERRAGVPDVAQGEDG